MSKTPQRTVNREPIDLWIDKNGPNGIAKLAIESGVSSSLLGIVRRGHAPGKGSTRLAICRVLGIDEDIVFPLVSEKSAS